MGNCGVTFAPVRPGKERYLAEMMESVEDIPADAVMDGLAWGWETYGDYLDALRRLPLGVNVGGLIGHCALRYYVMGERSLATRPRHRRRPRPDGGAGRARRWSAGRSGFSSSRSFMHTVPDGRPVPGTFALPAELAAIADALADAGRGVIEVVPRIGERDGPDRQNSVAELAWMEEVSRASGRPLTFAMMQSDRRPDLWSWVMGQVADARGRGADLRPQTDGARQRHPLRAGRPHALRRPARLDRAHGPPVGRAAGRAADADLRASSWSTRPSSPRELSGPLAPKDPAKLYLLPPGSARVRRRRGQQPGGRGRSPGRPRRRGRSSTSSLETDGLGLLYYPVLNQDLGAVAAMLANPDVIVGVADAGAHVALTMDAGPDQPTS